MSTICGSHVQCMYMYIHSHSMYTYMQCMCMVKSIVLTAILRGYIGGISLYVHNGRFLHNSILYTYVKGGTGKYAVATTVVVYAYNTWYLCTVYVSYIYTQYVHVFAMYIHILNSCLNMVGRVPLIPLILAGNLTPTSPHQYSKHKR